AAVIGNGAAIFVLGLGQGGNQCAVGCPLFITHSPENAANQQVVKCQLIPGVMIVTIGGVKHAAFALLTHPGPGFVFAQHQHSAILFIVIGVHIGFVLGFKAFVTLQDGMLLLS